MKDFTPCCHPETLRAALSGSSKTGFTLIELLVVVLIIGILAAVALPQYQKAVAKARAVEAVAVLSMLERARDVYYIANGKYPSSLEELDVTPPASSHYSYTYRSNASVMMANQKNGDGLWFEWYPPLAGDDKRKHCIVNEEKGPQYKQVCFSLGYTKPNNRIGPNQYYKLTQ